MERRVLQLGSERIAAARAWLRSAWPGIAIGVFMLLVPFLYYRHSYSTYKRFHVVDAEKGVYRSGCLTAQGFEDVIRRYGIKTVLNLQDEATNPALAKTYLDSYIPLSKASSEKVGPKGEETKSPPVNSMRWLFGNRYEWESEVCKRLGAEMIYLFAGHLRLEEQIKSRSGEYIRPVEIEQLLEIFDNPKRYPILIHCKAGLHRTGVTVALYRQEMNGWSKELALKELKANGFGELGSTSANQYILDYILNYRPGIRRPPIAPTTSAKSPGAQP